MIRSSSARVRSHVLTQLVLALAANAPFARPLIAQASANRACYVPASGTVYLIGLGSNTPSSCVAGHVEVSLGLAVPASITQSSSSHLLQMRNSGSGPVLFAETGAQAITASLRNTSSGAGGALQAQSSASDATAGFFNTHTTGYAVHAENVGSFPTVAAHNKGSTGFALHATSLGSIETVGIQNLGVGRGLSVVSKGNVDAAMITNLGAGRGLSVTSTGSEAAAFVNNGSGRAIFAGSSVASPEATAVFSNVGRLALRLDGSAAVNENLVVTRNADIGGSLRVSGAKNAIVPTSRGPTEVYSEEATEVWFADYGSARLRGGMAWVPIDSLFAETVALDREYHVFLQGHAPGNLFVEERSHDGFRVRITHGPADATFSYRIVAKRKGFEERRLNPASR